MDSKAIQTNLLTAIATAAVLGVLGWAGGVFSAGSTALDEAQIEAVIKRVLILDSGDTYAATLTEINLTLASMDATLIAFRDDINDLETAVGALAAE